MSPLESSLVSHRGIEANPTKIKAIETMRPPARIKDVQRLTGCLAALILFISRLAEKALPFFKLLRGSGPFTWTEEAEQAFQELKQHLTTLPILVAPELGETLFLYLTASLEAVSMVLVAERTVQSGQGGAWSPWLRMMVRPSWRLKMALNLGARTPILGVRVWNQTRRGPRDLQPRILMW